MIPPFRCWAVEVHDIVADQELLLPLVGPANRQGLIAADVISGRDNTFCTGHLYMWCV